MEIENELSELNLDELFGITESDDSDSTAEENTETITDVVKTKETENTEEINLTKAMSNRINEVTKKTKDNVAKELGFDNYEDLIAHKTKNDFSDAGIDIDDPEIKNLIEKVVNEKIANDPRYKKLEEFEAKEKNDFVVNQLKEINAIEGTSFTKIEDLPAETIEMFGKLGNLKQAYLATQGEKLLAKQANGSTSHLSNRNVNSSSVKSRPLNDEEKETYRMVFGDSISDDELSKIMKDI